jgi:hypothetical protein
MRPQSPFGIGFGEIDFKFQKVEESIRGFRLRK